MATNLALDDGLIEKAKKLGRHVSKKEAVNVALQKYVDNLEQVKIFDLFGKISFLKDYNYKKQRKKR